METGTLRPGDVIVVRFADTALSEDEPTKVAPAIQGAAVPRVADLNPSVDGGRLRAAESFPASDGIVAACPCATPRAMDAVRSEERLDNFASPLARKRPGENGG